MGAQLFLVVNFSWLCTGEKLVRLIYYSFWDILLSLSVSLTLSLSVSLSLFCTILNSPQRCKGETGHTRRAFQPNHPASPFCSNHPLSWILSPPPPILTTQPLYFPLPFRLADISSLSALELAANAKHPPILALAVESLSSREEVRILCLKNIDNFFVCKIVFVFCIKEPGTKG